MRARPGAVKPGPRRIRPPRSNPFRATAVYYSFGGLCRHHLSGLCPRSPACCASRKKTVAPRERCAIMPPCRRPALRVVRLAPLRALSKVGWRGGGARWSSRLPGCCCGTDALRVFLTLDRRRTSHCSRPRISINVIENLSIAALNARRLIGSVRLLT